MGRATLVDNLINTSPGGGGTGVNYHYYVNCNFTLSSLTNGYAIFGVSTISALSSAPQLQGATYNGIPLTNIDNLRGGNSAPECISWFCMPNPPSGTNQFQITYYDPAGFGGPSSANIVAMTWNSMLGYTGNLGYNGAYNVPTTNPSASITTLSPYDIVISSNMGIGSTPGSGYTLAHATNVGGVMYQEFVTPGIEAPSWTGYTAYWTMDAFVLSANLQTFTATITDNVKNGASRFETVARLMSYGRTISDYVTRGAGRTITAGKLFTATITENVTNGAGRFATASGFKHEQPTNSPKIISTVTNLQKTVKNVLAVAGQYMGFGTSNYSGGEILSSGPQIVYSSGPKNLSNVTNLIKE